MGILTKFKGQHGPMLSFGRPVMILRGRKTLWNNKVCFLFVNINCESECVNLSFQRDIYLYNYWKSKILSLIEDSHIKKPNNLNWLIQTHSATLRKCCWPSHIVTDIENNDSVTFRKMLMSFMSLLTFFIFKYIYCDMCCLVQQYCFDFVKSLKAFRSWRSCLNETRVAVKEVACLFDLMILPAACQGVLILSFLTKHLTKI